MSLEKSFDEEFELPPLGSIEDIFDPKSAGNYDPRAYCNVILIHEDKDIRRAIEYALKQNSFPVKSGSDYKTVEDNIRSAQILIAEVNNNNFDNLANVREKYSSEDLLIFGLMHESMFEKVKTNIPDIEAQPIYPQLELFTDEVESHWRSSIAREVTNDLEYFVTPVISHLNKSLKNKRIKAASRALNFLKKFLPNDKRTIDNMYKCFRYAQKENVAFPGIKIPYYTISTDTILFKDPFIKLHDRIAGVVLDYVFKEFKNEKRAHCEIESFKEIHRRNKINGWGRSKNIKLNIPFILGDNLLKYEDSEIIYLCEQYVKGPSYRDILSQSNEMEKINDIFARYFKKAVFFEKNKYLAFLQINPIKLPSNFDEKTPFAEFTKQSIIDNFQFFYLKGEIDKKEGLTDCLSSCVDAFYETLLPFQSTQFFDFSSGSIMFDIGEDRYSSFKDIRSAFLKKNGGKPITLEYVSDFIKSIFMKTDKNKTYFQTHFLEDVSHQNPDIAMSDEEKRLFDYHLMLYRKKAQLLNESDASEIYELELEVESLIKKIETNKSDNHDLDMIEKICSDDFLLYKDAEPIIRFYRSILWFKHNLRKYIPIDRFNANNSYEKMSSLLFEDKKSFMPNIKKGNIIEDFFTKYFEKDKKIDKRRFLHGEVFKPIVINDEIYDYLSKEHIDSFVTYANIFIASKANELEHNKYLKFHFNEAYKTVNEIVEQTENLISEKTLADMPKFDGDFKKYKQYVESLKDNNLNKNNNRIKLRFVSSNCIKHAMDLLKPKVMTMRINYDSLLEEDTGNYS